MNRQAPVLRVTQGRPLLTMGHLRSIAELQPFFNTICLQQSEKSTTSQPKAQAVSGLQVPSAGMTKSQSAPDKLEARQAQTETQPKTCHQYVEELLERDFLETVP